MEVVYFVQVSITDKSGFHHIQGDEPLGASISTVTGVSRDGVVAEKAKPRLGSTDVTDASLDLPAVVIARDFGCKYMVVELKCQTESRQPIVQTLST